MSKGKIIKLFCLLVVTVIFLGVGLLLAKVIYSDKEDKIATLYFDDISTKKELGRKIEIETRNNNIYYDVKYPTIGEETIDNNIKDNVLNIIKQVEDKYLKEEEKAEYYLFLDYEIYIGLNSYISLVFNEKVVTSELDIKDNKLYTYIYDIKTGRALNKEDIFKGDYLVKLQEYVKDQELKEDFLFIIKNNKIKLIQYDVDILAPEVKDYLNIDIKGMKDYSNTYLEPEYTTINKELQVSEDTIIYSEDSLNGKIIDKLKKDTIVKVYSSSDKGWSLLLYNDAIGYVESKYLKEVVVEVVQDKKTTVYAIADVNIRKEPSSSSAIIGVLKTAESITKLGDEGGWTQVEYNGEVGYVDSSYLSLVKVKKREVKLNVAPQGDIDPTKPMVALSFDDGPSSVATPKILDVLEKYNVRATFFDLGKLMKKYPNIVKREASLGEVGTHTYAHKNLNNLSVEALEEEIRLSKEAYYSVLGYYPILMRPPYGSANATVKALVDMPIINWNVDTLDWKYRNKDLILNEIDKYGNLNGSIILMHSIYNSTAEAVAILVPDLLDKGYQIVTVSELAAYKGYTLETGTIYHHFK